MQTHPSLSVSEATDILTMLTHIESGDWDKAHDLAQSQEGVWAYDRLHAYLHLLEGDQWNAGYWYRRCGITPSKVSKKEEWQFLRQWINPFLLPTSTLFHVVETSEWESQIHSPTFLPATYASEGFIHLCTEEQLPSVLERYYAGRTDISLLTLDAESLKDHLKMEPGPTGDYFPHLFSAIPSSAVIKISAIENS